jgi:uncharacterized protein
VIIIYGGFVALLYLAQRSLQYFPERRRTPPSAVGLTKAEEVVLDTADSERVIVWHVPPWDERPVFLYFHGNGSSLRWREERFHDLIADGSGLVALSYAVTAANRTADREGPYRRRQGCLCLFGRALSCRTASRRLQPI